VSSDPVSQAHLVFALPPAELLFPHHWFPPFPLLFTTRKQFAWSGLLFRDYEYPQSSFQFSFTLFELFCFSPHSHVLFFQCCLLPALNSPCPRGVCGFPQGLCWFPHLASLPILPEYRPLAFLTPPCVAWVSRCAIARVHGFRLRPSLGLVLPSWVARSFFSQVVFGDGWGHNTMCSFFRNASPIFLIRLQAFHRSRVVFLLFPLTPGPALERPAPKS